MENIDINVKIQNIQNSSSPLDILPKYLPDVFNNDYFFVSYSHKDYKEVYEDLLLMQENGIRIWYDRGMPAGKDWQEIATKYMYPYACKGVIFYLSKNSVISDATIRELRYAKQLNKPILVIHINEDKSQALHEMVDYLLDKDRKNDFYDILPTSVIYLPISMPVELRAEKISANLKEVPKLIAKEEYIEDLDSYTAIIIKTADTNITSINKYDIINAFKMKNQRKGRDKDFFVESLIIKRYAFANSELLKTFDVSFFDKIFQVIIEDYAFADCTSLTEFIGSPEWDPTYLIVQKGAFSNCSSLKSLNCAMSLSYDGSPEVFKNCSSIEKLDVRVNGVIGHDAFYNCRSLRTINLKGRTNKIEDGAFAGCESLKSFYVPNGVVFLGNRAFGGCKSLKTISLPDSIVCERRSSPFRGCDSLSKVIFRGKKKDYIENGVLVNVITSYCQLVTEVVCDDGVVPINRDKK